jgi:integrase
MPLTDTAYRNAKPDVKPRKMADGGGLYLFIVASGGKLWRLDYRWYGKRKTLSLGSYPAVGLADARQRREAAKKLLSEGKDPGAAKQEAKRAAKLAAENTFEAVARLWHANEKDGWTDRYAAHVKSRLEADIFPEFGARPIVEIEAPEVLAALRKVERRGALEIAKRLRQTVGQVFRFGIVTGVAKRDPSADLKGALKAAGRQVHHKAMPREELPGFLQALDSYDGDARTRIALRLVVLTFVRTTELRAARWSEFEDLDGEAPLWRIAPERMKMQREHLVPLARQAVGALKELKELSGQNPYLFPSHAAEGFMSNNTMLYALYRLGYHGRATVHGFRGVASTLLNEWGFNPDWIERQLAHDERDAVRAAYNSAQYLLDRRRMMQHWADALDAMAESGKVMGEVGKAA